MNESLYHDFLRLNAQGVRAEAKLALKGFVASFTSAEEKTRWLFPFLRDWQAQAEPGVPIRFELYRDLAFPILHDGYRRGDETCLVWLAKTEGNLASDKTLWRKIDFKTAPVLLEEAYALHPRDETRRLLLRELLRCCETEAIALEETNATTDADNVARRSAQMQRLARSRELDDEQGHVSLIADLERQCTGGTADHG